MASQTTALIGDPRHAAPTPELTTSPPSTVIDISTDRTSTSLSRLGEPPSTNIPGTALGSFGLRGSATVLFEQSGQTQEVGLKRMGMLSKQAEVGLMGIVDGLTDGTLDDIDPDRYGHIPLRVDVED